MTKLVHLGGAKNDSRVGDVILVHGLGGDPKETWKVGVNDSLISNILKKNSEKFKTWADWLGEDHNNLCYWSLDYDASPSKWIGSAISLSDRATNCLVVLDNHNLGNKPICFITHSMGGLVVKQMLRHSSNLVSEEFGSTSNATKAIVFFSTPHQGAELADFINTYFKFFLKTTVAVNELEAHHPQLRELTQWYRNESANLGIRSKVFFETQKTSGITVVNPTSADIGIPNISPIPVDSNHFSICKPDTKDSLVYMQTSKFLNEIFTEDASKNDQMPYELTFNEKVGFIQNYALGPAVPIIKLEQDIIDTLNDSLTTQQFIELSIETNRLRKEADKNLKPRQILIPNGALPNPELGLENYSFKLISNVFVRGPKMVVAFILSLPIGVWSAHETELKSLLEEIK